MNSNTADSPLPEKRVQLPEPDMENITVLTRELPNEPILPWHRYDSPWLESEDSSEEANNATESVEITGPDTVESSEDSKSADAIAPDISALPEQSSDGSAADYAEDIIPDDATTSVLEPTPSANSQNGAVPQAEQADGSLEAEATDVASSSESDPNAPANQTLSSEDPQSFNETACATPVLPYLIPTTPVEVRLEGSAPSPESEH